MSSAKYYELLDNAPEKLAPIARLFRWSENYDYPTPATLYLDLIGYSEDELGERLCSEKMPALGYLELNYLGAALTCYSERPQAASEFVQSLLDAETGWNEEEEEADNV